jgi:phosphomevalonate kinase
MHQQSDTQTLKKKLLTYGPICRHSLKHHPYNQIENNIHFFIDFFKWGKDNLLEELEGLDHFTRARKQHLKVILNHRGTKKKDTIEKLDKTLAVVHQDIL